MELLKIDENIWVLGQPLKFPGFGNIGTRMTVIRLKDEGLMIISPIGLTPAIEEQLQKLGTPRYIVSPNSLHHLFVGNYKNAFPQAILFAPKSVQAKRPDLKIDQLLTNQQDLWPWSAEVDTVLFNGRNGFEEYCFFHKASKSFIAIDLVFNVQRSRTFSEQLFLTLNRAYKRFGMTRVGHYIFNDKKSLRTQVLKVIEMAPQKIIPCHGDLILTEGQNKLREAFKELLP